MRNRLDYTLYYEMETSDATALVPNPCINSQFMRINASEQEA